MDIYRPYTYLIGWSKLDIWYYGVRFAKTAKPEDLWVSYFTSSKHVKQLRKHHGEPDVVEVRKTFTSVPLAQQWEHKVLRRLKVTSNPRWINRTDNISISPEDCANHLRGKSYEEVYGAEKAKQLKESRSISNRTRNVLYPSGERHGNYGRPSPNKGIPMTEEQKEKMRGPRSPRSKEAIEKARQTQIGKLWYVEMCSGKAKKFHESDVPEGWVRGRVIPN